jgi:hypothetical protein
VRTAAAGAAAASAIVSSANTASSHGAPVDPCGETTAGTSTTTTVSGSAAASIAISARLTQRRIVAGSRSRTKLPWAATSAQCPASSDIATAMSTTTGGHGMLSATPRRTAAAPCPQAPAPMASWPSDRGLPGAMRSGSIATAADSSSAPTRGSGSIRTAATPVSPVSMHDSAAHTPAPAAIATAVWCTPLATRARTATPAELRTTSAASAHSSAAAPSSATAGSGDPVSAGRSMVGERLACLVAAAGTGTVTEATAHARGSQAPERRHLFRRNGAELEPAGRRIRRRAGR